jgi:type IV secretory pathway VirB2 component (pilin)
VMGPSHMLADPGGASSLVAALAWVQGTLLGTVATLVAVIAIASVGLMMLAGRIDVRHGIRIVLGCFILFGASTIAAGIQAGFSGAVGSAQPVVAEAVAPPPMPALPERPPQNADPYAGASVPVR